MSEKGLRIVKGARKVAERIESASRVFERELARVYRDLTKQLGRLVDEAAEGSRTAIVKGSQAAQLRRELRRALEVAGYDVLVDVATDAPLDAIAKEVLRSRLATASATLAKGIEPRLAALRALQFADLLEEGTEVARALHRATIRGVFNSRDPQRILDDLVAVLDDTEPHIQTFYDTSLSVYARQVESLAAGDDDEAVFAFMGPIDDKTRPFCLKHAGRVYTRAQIDALDNGQLDNVFLTGGGYNCRHMWMEVSKASELRDLANTRDRVPEVQGQLDDLEEAA